MKKVLSLMLVLLMILSSMSMVFADGEDIILISPRPSSAPTDVVGSSYEEAVKALMDAAVVSGYKDGTFRPGNTVTRAEACTFLVNYLAPTEEERNAAPDSGFSDVSGWATTFVNYAVEKGIVAGYKDGTFRPGNQVNYQEMAPMTVNALGIKAEELEGSWPDCYINKAKELGMYENISVAKGNKDEANRGDVAEMIYSLIKYKDTSAEEAVMEKLVASDEALLNAKSMVYEMVMEAKMSLGAESMDMTSKMKMAMILDPMTMYMEADMNAGGEQQLVEYYYLTEGSDLVMYMQMEGQWYKMNMGDVMGAAVPANPMEDMELYLKAYDNVRMEGKDVVNGKTATKIYCELGQEYIDEVMAEMGTVEDLIGEVPEEVMGMMDELFQSMKGFGYEMWIDDESGLLVKIRMDMTDLMKNVMDAIVDVAVEAAIEGVKAEYPDMTEEELEAGIAEMKAQLEAELGQLNFDKIVIEMVVTDIDKIEEIQVPAELKDAIDLGASTGAEQVTE